MPVPSIDGLQAQLDSFRKADEQRDNLINQIVKHYHELKEQYETQESQLGTINKSITKHSYVLALVDGDGAPFLDRLVQNATDGGAIAAYHLEKEIKAYIRTLPFGLIGDLKIKVQIFLNVDGLRRKLFATGILTRDDDFYNFVRQFNMHAHSFNMIDVGYGKEHADHKLRDVFADQLDNPLCKHIIFAACHDNGYLPFLRQYQYDKDISSRLSLLFTNSTQAAFKNLGEFQHIEFKSVFRDEPLPEKPASPKGIVSSILRSDTGTLEPTSINGTAPRNGQPSPLMPVALPKAAKHPDRTQSPTMPMTTQGATKTVPASPAVGSNWSVVANKGKPQSSINIAPTHTAPDPPKKYAYVNAQHQRLDPPVQKPTQTSWDAYNALRQRNDNRNFCNNWYLLGRCSDPNCAYEHDMQLNDGVLLTLKYMARRLPCTNGLDCRDVNCYLGHTCVYIPKCNNIDCRFARDQHTLNMTPTYRYNAEGGIQSV